MTTTTTPTSGAADLPEALINIAREIEALKRDCGMDPESAIAIQNGRYMAISYKVRALAAGQATAAQQPHRSGCTAGTDEECVQRGCGTNCPAVSPPADSVQEDAARLDFLIEQRAYVVSDPDACPGYWLHWARPDGRTWVQGDEHPTPRAAIDAARKQGARWQSAVRALTLHI